MFLLLKEGLERYYGLAESIAFVCSYFSWLDVLMWLSIPTALIFLFFTDNDISTSLTWRVKYLAKIWRGENLSRRRLIRLCFAAYVLGFVGLCATSFYLAKGLYKTNMDMNEGLYWSLSMVEGCHCMDQVKYFDFDTNYIQGEVTFHGALASAEGSYFLGVASGFGTTALGLILFLMGLGYLLVTHLLPATIFPAIALLLGIIGSWIMNPD